MDIGPDSGATKASNPMKPIVISVGTGSSSATHTFGWEQNLFCALALGALYSILPKDYHVYFYGFLLLAALDALRYYSQKGSMTGAPYTLPLVSLITMLIHPVRFWGEQGSMAMESGEGMSTNILGTKFMVFVTDPKTDPKLCREVFVGEGTYQLFAHPNAKWLFGSNNVIYMDTEPHKRFRAMLTPALFSTDALVLYAKAQEKICRKYMQKFTAQNKGKAFDVRIAFRSMAAAASQESFLGPYLNDDLREQLELDVLAFTNGFLCFPFPYFGTGLAKALAAKERVEKTVFGMLPKARKYIQDGNKPRCLLELWAASLLEVAQSKGVEPQDLEGCSDPDLATATMDFLFASQDATNSALTYAVDVLATRPDVVAKIRAETAVATKQVGDMVHDPDELKYTCQAATQLLHHKPPVPMVPHLVLKDATLGKRFIRKGSIVIPAVACAARVSGASHEYKPEEQPDNMFVRNPVFGAGQHKCPGRRYAESLLSVFFAVFVNDYDFERVGPRPGPDDIMYYPTLFPAQNMFLVTPRRAAKAE
eukprot:CAMPEP_0116822064 /NCGR_PEP_ID=MMETSP0418-20121206/59_1 /TAXON_ID=1158023 /ORGANISM="Astrosyne radiata, Strain 13vi08-1A" /LENGTH=536 /DNA_ID=CAMNT_0004450133 /DNA_START=52 /DNA_END=1662 /DNA_ORIENTATION=+